MLCLPFALAFIGRKKRMAKKYTIAYHNIKSNQQKNEGFTVKITLSFRLPLCCANIAHTTAEEKPRTISTLIAYLFVCLNAWLLTLLLFKNTNQIVLLLCAIMIIMGQTLFFTISPASIFDETEKKTAEIWPSNDCRVANPNQMRSIFRHQTKILFLVRLVANPKCHLQR